MTSSFEVAVENIKCGGCANTIKNKLLAIPEIHQVEVEIQPGLVKISADLAQKNQVVALLAQLGYPEVGSVEGLKSVGAKAKSFVSCAIGRMSEDRDSGDKA